MSDCTICGKLITFHPSAEERARRTGYPAAFFLKLFTQHSECTVRSILGESNG